MERGFPWLWLYAGALRCGLSAEAFWASSPRAVYLIVRESVRKRTQARGPRAAARPGRPGRPGANANVRLSRLPHP